MLFPLKYLYACSISEMKNYKEAFRLLYKLLKELDEVDKKNDNKLLESSGNLFDFMEKKIQPEAND